MSQGINRGNPPKPLLRPTRPRNTLVERQGFPRNYRRHHFWQQARTHGLNRKIDIWSPSRPCCESVWSTPAGRRPSQLAQSTRQPILFSYRHSDQSPLGGTYRGYSIRPPSRHLHRDAVPLRSASSSMPGTSTEEASSSASAIEQTIGHRAPQTRSTHNKGQSCTSFHHTRTSDTSTSAWSHPPRPGHIHTSHKLLCSAFTIIPPNRPSILLSSAHRISNGGPACSWPSSTSGNPPITVGAFHLILDLRVSPCPSSFMQCMRFRG